MDDVLAAEAELRRAVLDGDLNALDRLLAEDVLFVGPDGSVLNKAGDLEAHRSGRMRIVRYEPKDEPRVREISADVFRLLTTVELELLLGEDRHQGRYLYSRIWIRREGRFRVAFAQAVPALVE